VTLRDGACLEYDSLIVSTGSKTSYYGKDEWRPYAPSLKTVEEATIIRHKILYAFEWAERSATEAEAREWLTFVIVGAGATGLELAGALAEIANETLKNDFRRINPKEARIVLMEGGDRVLAAYPPDLSEKAEIPREASGCRGDERRNGHSHRQYWGHLQTRRHNGKTSRQDRPLDWRRDGQHLR